MSPTITSISTQSCKKSCSVHLHSTELHKQHISIKWFNERHTINAGNTANFTSKRTTLSKSCNVRHNIFIYYFHISLHRLTIHRLRTNRYNELSNTFIRGRLYLGRRVFKALCGSFIPGAHFITHSYLVVLVFCYHHHHTVVEFGLLCLHLFQGYYIIKIPAWKSHDSFH